MPDERGARLASRLDSPLVGRGSSRESPCSGEASAERHLAGRLLRLESGAHSRETKARRVPRAGAVADATVDGALPGSDLTGATREFRCAGDRAGGSGADEARGGRIALGGFDSRVTLRRRGCVAGRGARETPRSGREAG